MLKFENEQIKEEDFLNKTISINGMKKTGKTTFIIDLLNKYNLDDKYIVVFCNNKEKNDDIYSKLTPNIFNETDYFPSDLVYLKQKSKTKDIIIIFDNIRSINDEDFIKLLGCKTTTNIITTSIRNSLKNLIMKDYIDIYINCYLGTPKEIKIDYDYVYYKTIPKYNIFDKNIRSLNIGEIIYYNKNNDQICKKKYELLLKQKRINNNLILKYDEEYHGFRNIREFKKELKETMKSLKKMWSYIEAIEDGLD